MIYARLNFNKKLLKLQIKFKRQSIVNVKIGQLIPADPGDKVNSRSIGVKFNNIQLYTQSHTCTITLVKKINFLLNAESKYGQIGGRNL